MTRIERALLSCTNKSGLVDFAKFLQSQNIEILSTGGTAKTLREAGVTVKDVAEHTGFPEMLDGRVKTLHPKIHGGFLFKRNDVSHQQQVAEHNITPIDLVVVNLYEFSQTVANPNCIFADAIENIDIGGPAMLRSAAKNHDFVTVITDPSDYVLVQNEIAKNGNTNKDTRQKLALKVYQTTSRYDAAISDYLANTLNEEAHHLADIFHLQLTKIQDLRYGENPHQQAAFYKTVNTGLSNLTQHQGKELSFNNILDTEAAYRCVLEFAEPACVIVKHNNPCGVAIADDLLTAFDKAKACDPVSSFGGVIAVNKPMTATLAKKIAETFFEVILAPHFDAASLEIFAAKKNLRLISLADFFTRSPHTMDIRIVSGGALVQNSDNSDENLKLTAKAVTSRIPSETEWRDLQFVWKVAKHVKSNAIVFGKNGQTLGIGAGQMSRIDSTRIAALKATEAFGAEILQGSSLASDAFFPFRDGVDAAIRYGVKAIAQPGGSMRDDEVILAANENQVAMVFTGVRHFRH